MTHGRSGGQTADRRGAAGTRALAALVGAAVALASGGAAAYRTGPPPGHTGAFGEPDCGACHVPGPGEDSAGSVVIEAPAVHEPGRRYPVTVAVRAAAADAAGFQLSARFADGHRAGAQAGSLEPLGPETRVEVGENGVAYATHTAEGAARSRWTVLWKAPEGGGAVALDVAANAANDDDSEFGDRIYRARHRTDPAPP